MKSRTLRKSRKSRKSSKSRRSRKFKKKTSKSRKSGGTNLVTGKEASEYRSNVNSNLSFSDQYALARGRTVVKPVTVSNAGADKEGDDAKPLSKFANAHVVSKYDLVQNKACDELKDALNKARDEYDVDWHWSTANIRQDANLDGIFHRVAMGSWIERVLESDGSHKVNANGEEQWRMEVQRLIPVKTISGHLARMYPDDGQSDYRYRNKHPGRWETIDQDKFSNRKFRQPEFSIDARPISQNVPHYDKNGFKNYRFARWSGPYGLMDDVGREHLTRDALRSELKSQEGGGFVRAGMFNIESDGDDGDPSPPPPYPKPKPKPVMTDRVPTGDIIQSEARLITSRERNMFDQIRACEVGMKELEARIDEGLATGKIQTKEQRAAEAAKAGEEVESKSVMSRMSRMSKNIRRQSNSPPRGADELGAEDRGNRSNP
ncbi:hypothetical protein N9O88_00325 [bacterium]|nr:hypothetical protein [bacterium]